METLAWYFGKWMPQTVQMFLSDRGNYLNGKCTQNSSFLGDIICLQNEQTRLTLTVLSPFFTCQKKKKKVLELAKTLAKGLEYFSASNFFEHLSSSFFLSKCVCVPKHILKVHFFPQLVPHGNNAESEQLSLKVSWKFLRSSSPKQSILIFL